MSNRYPMTVRGEALLREELTDLKSVQRPKVIAAIAEAREHGDLKENAEYHAAREQQSFIEGRLKEIEGKLGNAQVIDISKLKPSDKVVFGCTVELLDLESDETVKYQIVGDDEADFAAGRISCNSPVSRAIIGKTEGTEVAVETPGGGKEYEIMAVKYI